MSDSTESIEKIIEENREILDKFVEWTSNQPHIPKNIRMQFYLRKENQ